MFTRCGIERPDSLQADPPQRPILLPALLVGGLAVALGLGVWGRPLSQAHPALTLASTLANVASGFAAFTRAREFPREARGWKRLGWAMMLLALANVAAALDYRYPNPLGDHNVIPVIMGVLGQILSLTAFLAMPWNPATVRPGNRNLLGSGLFVGSILLILWTLTSWKSGFRSHNVINLALVAACGRLTLLGGLTLVLLEQDPRRVRGVLGFVMVNVFLGAFYVALLQTLLSRGTVSIVPFASVFSVSPLILGLAAWSRAPLELPAAPVRKPRFWLFLPYAAFALAAVALLIQLAIAGRVETVPLVGFISLTWLLLYRQFLLLKELRMDNLSLEERVKERTRDLETMQNTVLRTERLNTLASLGAGLAHDLNNFLCVIRSSAHMIQQDLDQGCLPTGRHLDRIHATTDRASKITSRLMGFARRDPDPPKVLDLGEELDHLEDLLRMLLPRFIRLNVERAPGHHPVRTRRTSLEQILVNLVSNAKDAMSDPGVITIRLDSVQSPAGPALQLQVEDTGPGLPLEVKEHLFEYFVTTKVEGKGTGLGLATVKNLVDGDKGTITVLSEPGAGCLFLITYPLATEG